VAGSDDPEAGEVWLSRLYELNAAVAEAGEPVAGNLFYDHHQPDYLRSPPIALNRAKRNRFRRVCAERGRMLEIGVNAGHSAYLALTSNPALEFHGVDIGEHAYLLPAVAWLEKEFPGRVFFYEGSCLRVLPALARRGLRFDLVHVDGAKHTYYFDVLNAHRLADEGALIVVDDANMGSVQRVWERCVREGLVLPLPEFPTMFETHRNAIGMLPEVPRWRRVALQMRASMRQRRRRLRGRLSKAW
jgi:predicted O-methyltransferase YrrM